MSGVASSFAKLKNEDLYNTRKVILKEVPLDAITGTKQQCLSSILKITSGQKAEEENVVFIDTVCISCFTSCFSNKVECHDEY